MRVYCLVQTPEPTALARAALTLPTAKLASEVTGVFDLLVKLDGPGVHVRKDLLTLRAHRSSTFVLSFTTKKLLLKELLE